MILFYNFLFSDNHHINLNGDNAITFLAVFLTLIMCFSLLITNWITTQKKQSKGKSWIPTSSNIKPNINKF